MALERTARLMAFVATRLDEAEMIAREASRAPGYGQTVTGEHWRWECEGHDLTITPDPMTEILECPHGCFTVGLRSIEHYRYNSIAGEGPHLVLGGMEEVTPVVAMYLLAHDPARVLTDIAAKRAILADCARLEEQALDGNFWNVTAHESIVARLALAWSEHPDFDPEWRP